LSPTQTAALRKELQRAAAARTEARKLKDLPRGRYLPTVANPFAPQPHWALVRTLSRLLAWDGWLRAQDGDLAGALESCRAALNAGRSLGDEPGYVPQAERLECRLLVRRLLERALAQGEAPPVALEALQQALADEAEQPLLLAAFRGCRASFDRDLESVQTRKVPLSAVLASWGVEQTGPVGDLSYALVPGRAQHDRAGALAYLNRCVEIAKLPAEQQPARIKALSAEWSGAAGLVRVMVSAGDYWAEEHLRSRAELRCAVVALAVERYRQEQGHWPESLATLVPRFLPRVPADLYDGQPLRLGRFEQGVVIYSVGADGQDDGGKIGPPIPGPDLGIRLWDVRHRRQSPPTGTPVLPTDGE
jgi:hypothetical protein